MSDDLSGKLLGGKYEIIKLLGEGGMGRVWYAQDHDLNRPVAIKTIQPEHADWRHGAVDEFTHEARVIANLEHNHILKVYDFGREIVGPENLVYLVMMFASSGTLADRLRTDPYSPNAAKGILKQVCEALDYIHDKGVIHRDVKPPNVLFGVHDNVLVADFGLAKLLKTATYVKASTCAGTPGYMPPEQFSGGRVGPFSDVYAVGVMLCEMLTGQLPQQDDDWTSQTSRSLSLSIQAVIEQATQSDSSQRYQSAGELAGAFVEAVNASDQEELEILPPGIQPVIEKPNVNVSDSINGKFQRAKNVIIGAIIAVLIGIASLLFHISQPSDITPPPEDPSCIYALFVIDAATLETPERGVKVSLTYKTDTYTDFTDSEGRFKSKIPCTESNPDVRVRISDDRYQYYDRQFTLLEEVEEIRLTPN